MSRPRKPLPPPVLVGETLPAACDAHEVARAFGVSLNTVYDWRKAGKLRKFELRQPMGSRRWSGRLLQMFLDAGAHRLVEFERAG